MSNDGLALRKTKRLLLDWVNLPAPVTDDWLDSMLKKHPDVFGPLAPDRANLRDVIERVRTFLQVAWRSTEMRQRDWSLFVARQEYSRALLGKLPFSKRNVDRLIGAVGGEGIRPYLNVTTLLLVSPPPETAFDRAVLYEKRMSCCEGSDCEEPYFLRGPKRERYCSECKREARLRSKRKYWSVKGKTARVKKRKATLAGVPS